MSLTATTTTNTTTNTTTSTTTSATTTTTRKKKNIKVKRCSISGCSKQARGGASGLCIRHNGGRRCVHVLCTKAAQGGTTWCIGHGGGRRCATPGCPKSAQRGGKCNRCGGGEACSWPDCTTAAQERIVVDEATGVKEPRCAKHGGARKCAYPDCMKTADPYSPAPFFCPRHGGRVTCVACQEVHAMRGYDKCRKCGGGRLCVVVNCNKLVSSKKLDKCHQHSQPLQHISADQKLHTSSDSDESCSSSSSSS